MKKFVALFIALAFVFGLTAPALASTPGELLIWADDNRIEVLNELVDDFEEEFGVEVTLVEKNFGDILDDLAVEAPAGEGPDIFIGAHDWLGELIENGLVEPLDVPDIFYDDFEEVALDAFTYREDVYGVPYTLESVALIYNEDLVSEPPETFDEFAAIVREISAEDDKYGFTLPQPDPYHTYPYMTALGGYVFHYDEEEGVYDPTDIGLNNEGAVRGLEMLNDLYADGSVPYVDFDTMEGLMTTGDLAMTVGGPWLQPAMDDAGINYNIAPIPTMEGEKPQPFVGVHGFMISSFSENRVLAQALLTEMVATEETMYEIYEAEPRPPVHLGAAERVADDEIIQGFLESGAEGRPMPDIPEMAGVWAAWEDAISLIFTQEQDVQPAMDDAVEQIREAIE